MRFLVIAAIAVTAFSCSREPELAAKPLDPSLPYVPTVLVAPTGPPEVLPGGYLKIGFDRLSTFPFVVHMADPTAGQSAPKRDEEGQIPDEIKALDGKKVLVTGFMLATKLEGSLVTQFILQKDQFTCCYGGTPQLNDWIVVKFKAGGIKNLPDIPLSFYGTLHVATKFDSVGFISNIYELDAERMAPLK